MKKRFIPLITLLIAASLILPAYADLIFEPNNSFYNSHQKECTYINRSFYANGEDGYVDFLSAPNGFILDRFENGTSIHISWQYKNWGCASIGSGKSQTDGWISLDDLILIYDSTSFAQEYENQIVPYNGEFSDFDQKITCINFYEYPGAPEILMTKSLKDNTTSNQIFMNNLTSATQSPISSVFTDESGLTWGYISYWRGYRNIWFCLDDPAGDSFPVRNTAPNLIPPSTPPSVTSEYLPYLLIGTVAVVTATLLILMGIRSKKAKKHIPDS